MVRLICKKKQIEALAYLVGIARYVHKNNVKFAELGFAEYTYVIEAIAELAYIVGGIRGMNTVKRYGFEWEGGESDE